MAFPHPKRGSRVGAIEFDILDELSAGDLLVSILCSARSTRRMYKIAREKAMYRYRKRLALERLADEGFVHQRDDTVSLTPSGRQLLDKTIVTIRNSLQTKRWDGKWRIITFDIPESLRKSRDMIRSILKRAGFTKLQHSTWVFPHDCEELPRPLKQDKRLARHVLYGVLERIENDAQLRRTFSLM